MDATGSPHGWTGVPGPESVGRPRVKPRVWINPRLERAQRCAVSRFPISRVEYYRLPQERPPCPSIRGNSCPLLSLSLRHNPPPPVFLTSPTRSSPPNPPELSDHLLKATYTPPLIHPPHPPPPLYLTSPPPSTSPRSLSDHLSSLSLSLPLAELFSWRRRKGREKRVRWGGGKGRT